MKTTYSSAFLVTALLISPTHIRAAEKTQSQGTWKLEKNLSTRGDFVESVAWSPDGKYLASYNRNRRTIENIRFSHRKITTPFNRPYSSC